MKIDVTIGNPPYNNGTDLDFIVDWFNMALKYTVVIVPAKWQTADLYQIVHSNYENYRTLRDKCVKHIREVMFFPDCKDVFDIMQADGITYFLMDKDTHNKVYVESRCESNKYWECSREHRSITNRESLLNIGNEIVDYLGNYPKMVPSILNKTGRYKVITNIKTPGGGIYAINKNNPKAYYLGYSTIIDTNTEYKIGDDQIVSFASNSLSECESFVSWVNTRFTRFFIAINISKLTGIISNDNFRFVPAPPLDINGNGYESNEFEGWNHKYSDDELFEYYNIPIKYREVICGIVKER